MKPRTQLVMLLLLASLVVAAPLAQARVWTDRSGRTIEADFVRLDGANVIVSRRGKEISIPLEKLSDADQQYAKNARPGDAGSDDEDPFNSGGSSGGKPADSGDNDAEKERTGKYPLRDWRDRSGMRARARFNSVSGQEVILERNSGQKFSVPFHTLVEGDQEYVERELKKAGTSHLTPSRSPPQNNQGGNGPVGGAPPGGYGPGNFSSPGSPGPGSPGPGSINPNDGAGGGAPPGGYGGPSTGPPPSGPPPGYSTPPGGIGPGSYGPPSGAPTGPPGGFGSKPGPGGNPGYSTPPGGPGDSSLPPSFGSPPGGYSSPPSGSPPGGYSSPPSGAPPGGFGPPSDAFGSPGGPPPGGYAPPGGFSGPPTGPPNFGPPSGSPPFGAPFGTPAGPGFNGPVMKETFFCTNCNKELPDHIKAGDRCPHCRAFLAFEQGADGKKTYASGGSMATYFIFGGGGLTAFAVVIGVIIRIIVSAVRD